MVNLSTFSGYKLDKNQMKNVVGGQEELTPMSCRTAGGYEIIIGVTYQSFDSVIDDWNASHGGGSTIVGCENPF